MKRCVVWIVAICLAVVLILPAPGACQLEWAFPGSILGSKEKEEGKAAKGKPEICEKERQAGKAAAGSAEGGGDVEEAVSSEVENTPEAAENGTQESSQSPPSGEDS